MNPSNTCTNCGHDEAHHHFSKNTECWSLSCTCTRFTPTADSTDELGKGSQSAISVGDSLSDREVKQAALFLEDTDKPTLVAIRLLVGQAFQAGIDHQSPQRIVSQLTAIEYELAALIRRRDEEHLPNCSAVKQAERANKENAIKGKSSDYHADHFMVLCDCGVRLRAEFADTPTKRED